MGMRVLSVKLMEKLEKYWEFKWAIMDHLDSDFHVFYIQEMPCHILWWHFLDF